MSSGFGIRGTAGRCFYHFRDFAQCVKDTDTPLIENCKVLRDDYLECLHHNKEKRRVEYIMEVKEQKEHGGGHHH